jgi:hypothetical protein
LAAGADGYRVGSYSAATPGACGWVLSPDHGVSSALGLRRADGETEMQGVLESLPQYPYYDGKEFTSLSSGVITGAPLNILITTSVTPDTGQIQQELGNSPQNSDSSPAGMAVNYVKI